jgi:hypothetical protein
MPQLVKGGKWVFGWVIVGRQREMQIPPEANAEYGFQTGDQVFLLPGSRRSGEDSALDGTRRLLKPKYP